MTLTGVIGNKGAMPWRLRRDMKRFRKLTTPSAVVMGPKTYQSIGKPLRDRLNIVLTTNRDYKAGADLLVAHDARQALELAAIRNFYDFYVLGGATVYTSFLPLAEHLFITYVKGEVEGDTYFPHWDRSEWHPVWEETEWKQEAGDTFPTRFAEFGRIVRT